MEVRNTVTDASNTNSQSSSANKQDNNMGKDEFLQLLVAQLKAQDPMEPMKDKEFIAQMAQFSSLEQMKNIGQGFEQLNSVLTQFVQRESSDQSSAYANAVNLLGKEVTGIDNSGELLTGIVTGVSINNGEPKVYVGDASMHWQNIFEIMLPPDEDAIEPDQGNGGETVDGQGQSAAAADNSDTTGQADSTK
ncbi:hypothetical protein MFMK1_003476 [Metallumcola ferriviriculae]|uniref:Flagellar hook capping protein n=1 Tax=Metallumcola ferriviriculae TaxID=3039180 RepID=A0AAU0UT43_9FIRM|nr:hypothetical protein MFMK1_003476 [Desulfitibacteraceae bacterium MK1]